MSKLLTHCTIYPTESAGSRGATGLDDDGSEESKVFQEVIDRLSTQSGESAETDNIMKHIVTRVTDEDLVVEFYDSNENTLFDKNNKPRSTHDNARKYSYYAGRRRGLENLRGKHGNFQRPHTIIANWWNLQDQYINCLCRF